jgi:hypothetical protein
MLNAIHEPNQSTENPQGMTTDNPVLVHDYDLDTKFSNDPIAVRLYENQVYGTTYGRGLYRRALYNGTIDLRTSGVKYLVDLYTGEDWANQAKSDEQMLIIEGVGLASGYLYSWLRRYDAARSVKTPVLGCCVLDTTSLELRVLISDDETGIQGTWCLPGKPCRTARPGQMSPQILATNYDLS